MKRGIDFDGAWKEAFDVYLRPFLEFCFPDAAAQIDWSVPTEPLDQELQKIVRGGRLGRQRVDKLVKVRRIGGAEEWVLIHMEMQTQADSGLARRMYQYHHRIVDRFGRRTATLVVLGDTSAAWRPSFYEEELWGCRVRFEYPVCKLVDFRHEALENSLNPAAIVIAAHLAAQASRQNMDVRKRWKWELVRRLYERGYSGEEIHRLFRLIDWLMVLPQHLENEFDQEWKEFEMAKNTPHLTSIERTGIRKGKEEGRKEGAANLAIRQSRKRFPGFETRDEDAIRRLDLAALEALGEALLDFGSIADLRSWMKTAGASRESNRISS